MKVRYASDKHIVSKLIKKEDDSEILYKAKPMSALSVSVEGMKLLKVLSPSLGAGIDSMVGKDTSMMQLDGNSYTLTTMFTMFSENLTDEHFIDLQDKLLGSLIIDGKEVADVDAHFDDHMEDLIEVLTWLFKENFWDFIMRSAILRTKIASLMAVLSPEVKQTLQKGLNVLKTGTDTQQAST